LQQFHRFENATTVQCNAVLTNLLQLSIGQPSIAERAVAILENMELLEDTQRELHSSFSVMIQHNQDDNNDGDHNSAMMRSMMMRSSSSDVVEKVARPIPKPNRITVRSNGTKCHREQLTTPISLLLSFSLFLAKFVTVQHGVTDFGENRVDERKRTGCGGPDCEQYDATV
jgi:hypothetical protein